MGNENQLKTLSFNNIVESGVTIFLNFSVFRFVHFNESFVL